MRRCGGQCRSVRELLGSTRGRSASGSRSLSVQRFLPGAQREWESVRHREGAQTEGDRRRRRGSVAGQTWSMSGSFQCPATPIPVSRTPASEKSGAVWSRFFMTEPHVASRSLPVRHRFAQFAIHSPQPLTVPHDSTLWTMARPVDCRHSLKPRWNASQDMFLSSPWCS